MNLEKYNIQIKGFYFLSNEWNVLCGLTVKFILNSKYLHPQQTVNLAGILIS